MRNPLCSILKPQSPQDVQRYRKEYGDNEGLKYYRKDSEAAITPGAKLCLIGGACLLFGTVVVLCVKSKLKKSEKNNASKSKKDEIYTQASADKEVIQAKINGQKEVIEIRERNRRERIMLNTRDREQFSDPEVGLESYDDAISNGHLSGKGEIYLGFPYFRCGYTRGHAGATNVGKTTYLYQEAITIAGGKLMEALTADWHPIPPVHVVYFSLEQTYEEVQKYYGSAIEPVKSHFHLYCGQVSPCDILKTIQKYLPVSNEYGVVVYIDNYLKLESYASNKDIQLMNKELEKIRQSSYKTGHPLTPVKVFHTSSIYDPSKPFSLKSVRGDKSSVNISNEFTFLTYTSLGENYRIFGHLKPKHGEYGIVNVLEFAGTDVDQFRFIGTAKEADVLCTKDSNDEEPNMAVVSYPHKPGRKPTISLELAQQLQDQVTRGEKTWREIEQETGHKKSKIKERLRSSRKA